MDEGYFITAWLVFYAVGALVIICWLALALYRSSVVLLADVFENRPEVARSVNRLIMTGFTMLSLGYAFFLLFSSPTNSGVHAIEILVLKLGILLMLAGVHFCNMYVFYRLQQHGRSAEPGPPLKPPATVANDQPPFEGPQVGPGYPYGSRA
jgi:hypothetical protein